MGFFFNFLVDHIPTLTCENGDHGHKQEKKMSFLCRVSALILSDRVRSLVISKALTVDPLLPRIERSQMRMVLVFGSDASEDAYLLRCLLRHVPPGAGPRGGNLGHAGETTSRG